MTTKLTLSLENTVIVSAKKYAQKKGKSLSHIIENYLKTISSAEFETKPQSQKILKLRGVVKLPVDFDYKKELSNSINNKHGKR